MMRCEVISVPGISKGRKKKYELAVSRYVFFELHVVYTIHSPVQYGWKRWKAWKAALKITR
ncbi:hypothetical protein D3Z36_11445 [Lachnospiraceae bacterium]|nr:hypothetical protein [Lachnospiraceae bacterium]